jgi:hypothetical protein
LVEKSSVEKGFAGGELETGKTGRHFRPKQHQPTLSEESSAIRAQKSARGECAEQGKSAGQQMTHWDGQHTQDGAFGNPKQFNWKCGGDSSVCALSRVGNERRSFPIFQRKATERSASVPYHVVDGAAAHHDYAGVTIDSDFHIPQKQNRRAPCGTRRS